VAVKVAVPLLMVQVGVSVRLWVGVTVRVAVPLVVQVGVSVRLWVGVTVKVAVPLQVGVIVEVWVPLVTVADGVGVADAADEQTSMAMFADMPLTPVPNGHAPGKGPQGKFEVREKPAN
jgi:hypothetical protein